MQIEQFKWESGPGWIPDHPGNLAETAQLVLVFGETNLFKSATCFDELQKAYPKAHLLGCSTAGEIWGDQVFDSTIVATAIHFEHTEIKTYSEKIQDASGSYNAGRSLAKALEGEGLVHAVVISDGLQVNGSELVKGLVDGLPDQVTATGGLSADGDRFKETYVAWDGSPEENTIGILGFYSDRLRIGYGSLGGWDTFGPERLITRSAGNVLYEIDGKPALQLYKDYLGEEQAKGLPATGLLFPLSIRAEGYEDGLVRTILSVDENEQSMTFAGDVPEGAYSRLMKANFDRLLDGAAEAARTSVQPLSAAAEFALLVSCVGRKLVLKQIIDEEVEAVREVVGPEAVLAGFYSYGEISPFVPNGKCELHNQTMTITTFSEK